MPLIRTNISRAREALTLERLRVQLLLSMIAGVVVPLLVMLTWNTKIDAIAWNGMKNSVVGAGCACILSVILYRQVTAFPGIRGFRFVLPTYSGAFAGTLATMFAFRIEYNRPLLLMSFALALLVALASSLFALRRSTRRFYLVPFGRVKQMIKSSGTEWIVMEKPQIPSDRSAVIVADLHFDHEDAWEKMLAHAAVAGHPVYHVKQLRESLTGQVSIEHISENSFGSMLPNLAYRKVKRAVDLVSATVLLPVLTPLLLAVAILIKLDSQGPALFRQERMGYRGYSFRIFKFRTMHVQAVAEAADQRSAAMTGDRDPRITKIGHFLRRSRIDELPQIFNILAGDMSWIGPRPEAVALSTWYEQEIPFYFYRHIVRPGITGWAQVNQGHVSDIDAVSTKLGYDFFYIKNFSAWLDILITMRTVSTMLSGFGAK